MRWDGKESPESRVQSPEGKAGSGVKNYGIGNREGERRNLNILHPSSFFQVLIISFACTMKKAVIPDWASPRSGIQTRKYQ
jgi:hypothetical protein